MTTLAAGYDFLGKLGDDLRDLIGLDTLVYELVQNADDAPGANEMTFDISDDALRVSNDGFFTDCLEQGPSLECAGVEDGTGKRVRCDFHSLRLLAGQAKRAKRGTTGAFGIGFTSVFQVCDYPELITGGRHWVMRYDQPESDRIEVCDGCGLDHSAPGTTFVLPWARDPGSPVRRGLKMDPIEPDVPPRLVETAALVLPAAVVFLRKLTRIAVKRDGAAVSVVERSDERSIRRVKSGKRAEAYWTNGGSFEGEIRALRASSAAFTDDVRDAEVEIAVPLTDPKERLPLHVVLPTREETDLSLRVSAPFFPFQNRKSVRFETDAESAWNRAAIEAAAAVIRDGISDLVGTLPPARLWSVIRSLYRTWQRAESGAIDACFAEFWTAFLKVAEQVPTVPTTGGAKVTPGKATIVRAPLEFADTLLQALEFQVVDPAVRAYVEELAQALGVDSISIEAVGNAIVGAGLDHDTPFADLPAMLAQPEQRAVLYRLVNLLLERATRSRASERVTALEGAAVIPTVQGSLAPPALVSLEQPQGVELFSRVLGLLFADENTLREMPALRSLLGPLAATEAIDALAALPYDEARAFGEDANTRDLIRWFDQRRAELDEMDRRRLASLPIFPSSTGGYLPLTRMQLPGDFDGDPLGIVTLVDLETLAPLREFLEDDLDATRLDFHVYATELLPTALSDPEFAPSAAALDALLETLDGARTTIAEDEQARAVLGSLEIVACRDGARRASVSSYFDSDVVRAVLGNSPIIALKGAQLLRLRGTLELLGVNHEPEAQHVIDAVRRTVAQPKTTEARAQVRAIVEFLAPKFVRRSDDGPAQLDLPFKTKYDELREFAWLPVVGEEGWAVPRQLYRTEFRRAFSSVGRFIDLRREVQEAAAQFLRHLAVGYRPTADEIVTHIENCRRDRASVHVMAYRLLNDEDSEPAYERLRLFESICLDEDTPRFVSPDEVVAGPHSLGRYLVELPDELKALTQLVDGLQIPSAPNDVRAAAVLGALAGEYADVDRPIEAHRDALAILRECWSILERERERASRAEQNDETIEEYDDWLRDTLGELGCWPDARGRLKPPSTLLIDDMPQLGERLPVEFAARLIQFPREAPTALLAAGARALSTVVTTELRESANRRDEHTVSNLLFERRELVARVVAANISTGDSVDSALARLDPIRIYETDSLVIEHALVLDDEVATLGPQLVRAHLDRDAGALYVLAGGALPAREIAVQLTPLLCPDGRAADVAPALKIVLAAATPDEAKQELDDYGFAGLDREVAERVASEPARIAADDDEDDDLDDWNELTEDEAEAEPDDDEPEESWDDPQPEDVEDDSVEVDPDALERPHEAPEDDEDTVHGPSPARPGSRPRPGHVPRPRQAGGLTQPGDLPTRRPPPRGVQSTPWRTWVSGRRGAEDDAREEHPERTAARKAIEEAGMRRVIQYEADHGREATPMGANNRGFDIQSGKGRGRPVQREIEVKSLGSSWEAEWSRGGNPPKLTRPQFIESVDNGRRWLYVVENALDDDNWAIYPIQQVGLKATNFLLDHGWKEAADQPDAPGLDYTVPTPKLPSIDDRTWPSEEADPETDIPFVPWAELATFVQVPEADRVPPRWYAPPEDVGAADFATQQPDHSMSPRAPFGSILTIRELNGDFRDGQVVLADVGDGASPRLVVRRAFHESDTNGNVVGVLLEPELPTSERYELPLDEAAQRLRGYVILVDPSE